MALAIDTTLLTRDRIHWLQEYLLYPSENTTRFQIYRVCVLATVVHDVSSSTLLENTLHLDVARQEALDWQADQDDDLDEVEVLHHLKQQAHTSPLLEEMLSETERTSATTTLVASLAVQSPLLTAGIERRPLSSFHRYPFRVSLVAVDPQNPVSGIPSISQVVDFFTDAGFFAFVVGNSDLKIVGAGRESCTVWQLQLDIVDLLSQRSHPSWRPEKRGRSTLNPFHRVSSSPPVDPCNHRPEAKRFKGVRYRPERKKWTAEMKPPKYEKVSFGEFRSQAQAARVVDVAFYYYGKPHLLNFSDTPHMLSKMPPPAGLGVDDMLKFVKEKAKLVSSIASTLPSGSPASVTFAVPESSSLRGCTADNLEFRSLCEISSVDADDGAGGISVQPDLMAGLVGNGLMEPNLVAADAGGVISGTLQEQQRLLQWSWEDGFDDPSAPSSSGWDSAELSSAPGLTNNFVAPSQWMDGWIGSLLMSPPFDVSARPPSASNIQHDGAQG